MYFRFLKAVESSIGHFYPDEVHYLEDEVIINSWIRNGWIEQVDYQPVQEDDDSKPAPVRQQRVIIRRNN